MTGPQSEKARGENGEVLKLDLSKDDAEVAAVMRKACTEQGFLYATNHGVSRETIDAFFAAQRAFFALPEEDKLAVRTDENNRGYTPMRNGTLDPEKSKVPDTHEGLYFGRHVDAGSEEAKLPLHGPNQWPREGVVPRYREDTQAYFDAMVALTHRMLRVLSLSLSLDPDYFAPLFSRPITSLRPLHYTAEAARPDEGAFSAGAHTDYGCLTFLATDDVPGLQIFLDGAWVSVDPVQDAFVVNIGDMLERWTNGLYKSTLHRVVNTSGRERFSAAFFVEPNFDASVEPLACCCSEDNPSRYPPITSGEYLMAKYRATDKDYAAREAAAAALAPKPVPAPVAVA